MTVTTQRRRNDYTATGESSFAFHFGILTETDLAVYADGVLITNYTVYNAGETWGGSITIDPAPDVGTHITIMGAMPIEQPTDLIEGGPFPANSVEAGLDRPIMAIQQLDERADRAMAFGTTSLESGAVVDEPESGTLLMWQQVDGVWHLVPVDASDLGVSLSSDDIILTGSAFASFPAAGSAGRLRRRTDGPRGIWMDSGEQWVGVNGEIFNVRDYDATGDGSTDDTTAIQAAFTAHAASTYGGTVYFPRGRYITSSAISITSTSSKPLRIIGDGYGSRLDMTATNGITGSSLDEVEIAHLRITGTMGRAIFLTQITDVHIHHCWISGATVSPSGVGGGIYLNDATDVHIERCLLSGNGWTTAGTDLPYDIVVNAAGTGERIRVTNNRVVGGGCATSIAVYNPESVEIDYNRVDQGDIYMRTDTGYGILCYGTLDNVSIHHNKVFNTAGTGIYVAATAGGDASVTDNELYTVAQQQTSASLTVGGIGVDLDGDIAHICRNRIVGSNMAGISFDAAAIVTDNWISTTELNGIEFRFAAGVLGVVVDGNHLEGVGANVAGNGIGQAGAGINNVGVKVTNNYIALGNDALRGVSCLNGTGWDISHNRVVGGTSASTYPRGIEAAGDGHRFTDNDFVTCSIDILPSSGTGHVRRGNKLSDGTTDGYLAATTDVGNVGGGEDNLIVQTLPAYALRCNGHALRIVAWGSTANNSNPKTVKMYFGSAVILTTALTISIAGSWRIEAIVARTGSSTQDYTAALIGGATVLVDTEQGTIAETESATITVKCTGTVTDGGGGINNDDIIQKGQIITLLN